MRPRLLVIAAVVVALVLAGIVAAVLRRHDTPLESLIALGRPIYCGGGKGPYDPPVREEIPNGSGGCNSSWQP